MQKGETGDLEISSFQGLSFSNRVSDMHTYDKQKTNKPSTEVSTQSAYPSCILVSWREDHRFGSEGSGRKHKKGRVSHGGMKGKLNGPSGVVQPLLLLKPESTPLCGSQGEDCMRKTEHRSP